MKSFAIHNRIFLTGVLGLAMLVSVAFARSVSASGDASTELARMYELDQNDRKALYTDPKPNQWVSISAHDKEHHDRVLELMRQDKLNSAEDYYFAAMIMQHGNEPKDYMLAHIFATAAAQRGSKPAIWLSAASFDRLMQSAGQPQVFGTQYSAKGNEPLTVTEPMDLGLITDSVRKAFNAPTLVENEARLQQLNSMEKRK